MKTSNTIVSAGVLSAIAASMCCILPILTLVAGAGSVVSAVAWLNPLRPYFVGVTCIVLVFAWYQKLAQQKKMDCNCETTPKKTFFSSKGSLLLISVVAIVLMTLPLYSSIFTPVSPLKRTSVTANAVQSVEFKIRGMSCESCTNEVNAQIVKLSGVLSYQTALTTANSIVRYDTTKASTKALIEAINKTGYKVTSYKKL